MTRAGERTLRQLLAPLAGFLDDPGTTEVVVNRPGEVGVERQGQWSWYERPDLTFDRLDAIATLAAAMSQQDVGPSHPLCATVLPDGQRVQVCHPPAVAAGTISLTIRRPSAATHDLGALAAGGLFAGTEAAETVRHPLDQELAQLHQAGEWGAFLKLAVRARKTIIVTGDTGSGKTTLAKALVREIPLDERLITIEDTAEFMGMPHRNVVSLFYSKGGQGIAQIRSEELIEAALRMRPDRVLMQELRDGAAFTFVRSIAAGHPGSITTCHARSAEGAFDALRLMIKQNDAGKHLGEADIQGLLAELIDVVVHCQRLPNGTCCISQVLFCGGSR